MRIAFTCIATLVLWTPVFAQTESDPDRNVSGGVQVAGWQARLDRATQSVENLRFVSRGDGLRAITGQAAILFAPENTGSEEYTVSATFTQTRLPEHQEAYGLFVGGAELMGDGQRYTYFLIRQDGKFLIKRRQGVNTQNVVNWTDHASVQQPDAQGRITNTLTVVVEPDGVRFLANGSEFAREPRSTMDTEGVAGFRVNHNLDVQIDGFRLSRAGM